MSGRKYRRETPLEPMPTNVETRLKAAMAKRQSDFIQEAGTFTRHKVAFTGPSEFLVMCRKFYRFGFEDACK